MDRVVRQRDYVHMDEITLHVFNEPAHRAQQKSRLRMRVTGSGSPIVLMHYNASRTASVAVPLLHVFSGHFQTDGFGRGVLHHWNRQGQWH